MSGNAFQQPAGPGVEAGHPVEGELQTTRRLCPITALILVLINTARHGRGSVDVPDLCVPIGPGGTYSLTLQVVCAHQTTGHSVDITALLHWNEVTLDVNLARFTRHGPSGAGHSACQDNSQSRCRRTSPYGP